VGNLPLSLISHYQNVWPGCYRGLSAEIKGNR